MPHIRITNLSRRYGKSTHALRPISLTLHAPGVTALLGPSGSGKTTLARLLAGLEPPTTGTIEHAAADTESEAAHRDVTRIPSHHRGAALVSQHADLWPHLTAEKHIRAALPRSLAADDAQTRVDHLLTILGLTDHAKRKPRQLSGGQQRRVALARALAADPQLLILDEPFTGLDRDARLELAAIVVETTHAPSTPRDQSRATLWITHDPFEALLVADHIAVIANGKLEQHGTPTELLSTPATPLTAELLSSAFIIPDTNQKTKQKMYQGPAVIGSSTQDDSQQQLTAIVPHRSRDRSHVLARTTSGRVIPIAPESPVGADGQLSLGPATASDWPPGSPS